ncbi:glycoside hydrolase family protein [Pedobacter sp. SYSU D00535]|uniref:glycoside hydrolase family protein n=1 Tax=Pedobacter sp. SYSU D00535 TaxID=2810308 RepID=UPI001A96B78F|nr:glycoside hydrolase family protein [Pedobacter sp. SYSU D00535]
MKRREFISGALVLSAAVMLPDWVKATVHLEGHPLSDFVKKLKPVGRVLETEGYYVWCNSPIQAPDRKIHVFYSRWPSKKGMGGWINSSEIAHAVADRPEGPYTYLETVLAPRGLGFWDATTCHNPHIQYVDGKYCLFYMGNSNGKTNTKRIGLAIADSLSGPWKRPDEPLLQPGSEGAWDDHCTTNPAFVKNKGKYWLYYKSWNNNDYYNSPDPAIRGNRKYGLAVADKLEGPYVRVSEKPVIDFSGKGGNRQFEDAFVWHEKGKFKLLARDMGVYNHEVGLYLESKDGMKWTEPTIAYHPLKEYAAEPPAPPHLKRYGRLERPQLLFIKGKPAYLFTTAQGGRYMTASSFVLKID